MSNFDIYDIDGNKTIIPLAYQTVMGNQIDVRSEVEVFANRTSVSATAIIPSVTSGVTIGTFEIKSDYADVAVQEITLVNLASGFVSTVVNSGTIS